MAGMDKKLLAARELLRAANAIEGTRCFAVGPIEHYTDSIDHAIGNTLEFACPLLADMADEDEPYEEIGPEPLSRPEAILLLPKFIERCCEILSGPPPFPCMCMSTRAQTFVFFLLHETDVD